MKYLKFKKLLSEYPLFSTGDLGLFLRKKYSRSTLNTLKRWDDQKLLIKLRRGVYLLGDYNISDPAILAGKIYEPSYISLEYALGHYGIIPDMVFSVTSMTTRTTREFYNQVGHYSYHKIKNSAFGGFTPILIDGISYSLATPEKALVDFLYLNRDTFDGSVDQFKSYRFNDDFRWNKGLLVMYARLFLNKKTTYLVNQFIEQYCKRREVVNVAKSAIF